MAQDRWKMILLRRKVTNYLWSRKADGRQNKTGSTAEYNSLWAAAYFFGTQISVTTGLSMNDINEFGEYVCLTFWSQTWGRLPRRWPLKTNMSCHWRTFQLVWNHSMAGEINWKHYKNLCWTITVDAGRLPHTVRFHWKFSVKCSHFHLSWEVPCLIQTIFAVKFGARSRDVLLYSSALHVCCFDVHRQNWKTFFFF